MNLRQIIRLITPPILLDLAYRGTFKLRGLTNSRRLRPEWEYIPEGWEYAQMHPEVKGWNVSDVLETYRRKWPNFLAMTEGAGPLGVEHESDLATNLDLASHNKTMCYAYALALTAHAKNSISILDWGGGIGHYYVLAKALFPNMPIKYTCVDVPALADYGAKLFPEQRFFHDETCLQENYDLVIASTSLHYAQDWKGLFSKLSNAAKSNLYIACLPIVLHVPSFVFIQRPYEYGYNTEYLSWCLNRTELLEAAHAGGFSLIREFIYGYSPRIFKAPEQNNYRGFLFAPDEDTRKAP